VPENLIAGWPSIDSRELRILIDEVVGRPGQYSDRAAHPNTLYVPLAGASCRLVLTFRGREIAKVEPGPAFDADQWRAICQELDGSRAAPTVFGREYSFSSFRVPGWWQGTSSGVQILPPPSEAPRADIESADHPFVLEFPIARSTYWALTNYRRMREHRNLTLLLNTRLAGRASLMSRRPRHFWAGVRGDNGRTDIRWVQEFFFAPLGEVVTDSASTVSGEPLPQLEPDRYYEEAVHDGRGLFVPSDLDESIIGYYELARDKRAAINRAMFWMDMASREWTVSMSSSFAALVSAVESLTERGSVHRTFCQQCNDMRQHDEPGATEQFRAFFERYAPGLSRRQRRSEMYVLRSRILHGSELMELDGDWSFGWDPPWLRERELHEELWGLTRIAIRNWLESTTAAESLGATSTDKRGSQTGEEGGVLDHALHSVSPEFSSVRPRGR
jgi:hypothetical protein